jgi:hypothetical protein
MMPTQRFLKGRNALSSLYLIKVGVSVRLSAGINDTRTGY